MIQSYIVRRRLAVDATSISKLAIAHQPARSTVRRFYARSAAPLFRHARPLTNPTRRPFSVVTLRLATKSSGTTSRKTSSTGSKRKSRTTAGKKQRSTTGTRKGATKRKTPKRKPAKEVTPAEALRVKVKGLRKAALTNTPKMLPQNAFLVFNSANTKGTATKDLSSLSSSNAQAYRNLNENEKSRYAQIANENKERNAEMYDQWVRSHTTDQIRIANNARRQLNKIRESKDLPTGMSRHPVGHKYHLLKDNRVSKRPNTPFITFMMQRFASGDFANVKATEAMGLISREWKALSPSEVKKYQDEYEPLRDAYAQERARAYPGSITISRRSRTPT